MAPVKAEALLAFATDIYHAAGVPEEDARLLADTLVQADLWGHQSHGVMRLSWYLARLRTGVMKAKTAPKSIIDAGAIAVIDGDDGVGQVLALHAAKQAVARAKAHGIGAVAMRNSNHFGTAMYFTGWAARQGCVAFLSTNASPAIAPCDRALRSRPGAAGRSGLETILGPSPRRSAAARRWFWT